ncbi:MAG: flagellar type III secretion system pore protein FliP [Acidithiobacillus ferrooxidans]
MEPAHKDPHQGPGRTPAPFRTRIAVFGLIALGIPGVAIAGGLPAFTTGPAAGGGTEYSLSIQALIFMTVLVFLPAMLLMMTAFTRIIIVLSLLKQALGSTQMPPSQIIVGLSLFLTFFVMAPVFQKLNTEVLQPLIQNQINITQAMSRAEGPLRTFMLSQTRPDDLALFVKLSGHPRLQAPADTPMTLLIPAFITSELKTGFQIGFLIFIPFVIIDLVVAAVLMSMGMMMLSPVTVSFPFKLMLFVLVNGWDLVIGSLVQSFVH